jgi:hypothetical protein
MNLEWMQSAISRYDGCIRDTLTWMLERDPLGDGFINTKVNSITAEDYDQHSGLRGPDYTYGWIQGRGLEALITFSQHYRPIDPNFSETLDAVAHKLYCALTGLQSKDGHIYFIYDENLQPVRPGENGMSPQDNVEDVFTYSDAFASKGLLAAACRFDPLRSEQYLGYLMNVISAIEHDRFQMDETKALSSSNARQQDDDFGPRMILLGSSGLLHRNGLSSATGFADRFIDAVLDRYYDPDSGLILNVPGQDACNVGHAIEFCGFAFEHLQFQPNKPLVDKLVSILIQSLNVGLQGPGIALSLSAKTGDALSPYYPWWPIPEAIRACMLGIQLTGDQQLFSYLQQADTAFFSNYWQSGQRFAYQTRTLDGPVDFVPATPDLDPGYHTGLSLLAAIRVLQSDNLSLT